MDNDKLMQSNQAHADKIQAAQDALNAAIVEAYRMHLDIRVDVLEFESVGRRAARPQVDVTVMMPLQGRRR